MTNTDFRGNVQTQLYTLFADPGAEKKKSYLWCIITLRQ